MFKRLKIREYTRDQINEYQRTLRRGASMRIYQILGVQFKRYVEPRRRSGVTTIGV